MPTQEQIVDPQSIIVKVFFDISKPLHLQIHAMTTQLLCIYITFSELTNNLTRSL